jgi:hypothetical protein
VERFWDPSGVREFGTPEDMRAERKRGVQFEASNVQRRMLNFPLACVLDEDQVSSIGLDGGWTFPMGGRNLEMVRMRWTHVGAMWPSTNNARRTSGGHNLQTRGQIRAW